MSRTFPRALGITPANWVSRKVFIAGADDKRKIPSTEFEHSSAPKRQSQAAQRNLPVQICQKKEEARKTRPFGKEFLRRLYAAAVRAFFLASGSSSPSQRTLTIFETPGSCMVTP